MPSDTCPTCAVQLPPRTGDLPLIECERCATLVPDPGSTALPVLDAVGISNLASSESLELPPEFLRSYRVLSLLGTGGAGAVWTALHVDSHRIVAVKILRQPQDEIAMQRFIQEGRLLARVQHPNVLKVLDQMSLSGHACLITELAPGGSLQSHMQRAGALAVSEAVRLTIACLDGLAACHEQGIIHRDLKPANILLGEAGEPKIADLGLARCLDAPAGFTEPGIVMGTPRYVSPEQARGEPVGSASDIYAIGLILHEMIAGKPVFDSGTAAALLWKHVAEAPPRLSELVPGVPKRLEDLVLRALAKSVASRPITARAFASELSRSIESASPALPDHAPETREAAPASDPPRRSSRARAGAARGSEARRERAAPRWPGILALVGVAVILAVAGRRFTAEYPRAGAPASVHAASPTTAAQQPQIAAWTSRLTNLRKSMASVAEELASLRDEIDEERGGGLREKLQAVRSRAEVHAHQAEELVAVLELLAGPGPSSRAVPGSQRALALTARWLALARRRWVEQQIHVHTERARSGVNGFLVQRPGAGPEVATGALLAPLRQACDAIVDVLDPAAREPLSSGPELVDVLGDVHALSLAIYMLQWHPSSSSLVARDRRVFLERLGKLDRSDGLQLGSFATDLWQWGQSEGSLATAASQAMFAPYQAKTVERLESLAMRVGPELRSAIRQLSNRARAGFRKAPSSH